MLTFYLIIVIALFLLAISDLIVGVSNDAVNFLNSAVGAKAGTYKMIMAVAALGIVVGCTFSSGMMEVARKGIFHPEYFYFSEIILLFLAVMVTDVILLDTFNTFGMPTSTTVSIVFELLGAAVAFSVIKIYTDPNALGLGEYINTQKAMAIISGILLSVVVAFTVGMIVQYLTRLLFSFGYEKRLKYFGALWGGLAIAALTYFMLVKGAKGTSFMTKETVEMISANTWSIIAGSFVVWTIVLQILQMFTKVNILKLIVFIGTFSLAMAFAGNDLVNFIGVPLAGYNSYELYMAGGGSGADGFLMDGLAGKVPTPTMLLLLAGLIMAITLWTSKKAKTVIKTSLDLGRQYEGSERFTSFAVSRSMVRNIAKAASFVEGIIPEGMKKNMQRQFDEKPFIERKAHLGNDAPVFDLVRAAVTLVVSSVLIAIGTTLKLPLSTTYVTFMVFMGTSLADGAWGRESAVYRVSGVLSVIGGWFFTAFSAFVVAFILANIFYFGGTVAIVLILLLAGYFIYRSHRYHGERLEEQIEFEKGVEDGVLSKGKVIDLCINNLENVLGKSDEVLDVTLEGLEKENLSLLDNAFGQCRAIKKQADKLQVAANEALDKIEEDELEAGHLYVLVVEYLRETAHHVYNIVKTSLSHVDNSHKPLLPIQIEELRAIQSELKEYNSSAINVFRDLSADKAEKQLDKLGSLVKKIRSTRKNQIKRIKNHEIGTRNSQLFLHHLGEYRNLILFSHRIVKVFHDLVIAPESDD